MAEQGIVMPDTPPMALHRGRIDLLDRHLHRDRTLLVRTFSHRDIYPPELDCHADEDLALVGAPLGGATLLHIATEYEEAEVAGWLLDKGMNVNIRAEMNSHGFGGHTALFHCVVTYNSGGQDGRLARLLLDRGADPPERQSGNDFRSRGTRLSTSIAIKRRWAGAGSFMISRMCLSRWYVCSPSVAATNDVPGHRRHQRLVKYCDMVRF